MSTLTGLDQENLLYNRDRNISGVTAPEDLTGLSLTPVYGSTANFSAKANTYITDNFYYESVPLSLNSLTASFNVNYQVNDRLIFDDTDTGDPLHFQLDANDWAFIPMHGDKTYKAYATTNPTSIEFMVLGQDQ